MIRYPAPLEKGDVIGVTAPSSGVQDVFLSKLDNAIKNIEALGYKVKITDSVRKQKNWLVLLQKLGPRSLQTYITTKI